MNLLPFENLPAYKPRKFVPANVDWNEWSQLSPLFDKLETRAAEAKSPADLEKWLLDWSELNAAIDEEGSRRYIAMTCHTDNPDAEKAYLHFVEKIEPELKPRQFKLSQLFIAHPNRKQLPKDRYEVLDRDTNLHVELFRQENVPLETEEARLGQQYQKLIGSLTVQFKGEEKTLTQMGRYLEETDRPLRQEVWEMVANRRLEEAEKIEDIFDQLVKLREQIAKNAGFKNYLEYAFRARGRFDYTPADCVQFHDAIEKEIMPALRELQSERKTQLGLKSLRPWDLAVDPLNRPPLRPFEQVDGMVSKTQDIFNQLDKGLASEFKEMRDLRLLDLANRKGKAPGGYQSTLSEARLPFIFMNAVGVQRDVETLLHEAGHAFHALATRKEDLQAYRGAPIEFCEVASMSMELLGNEFIENFYAAPEAKRARKDHLAGIINIFPWIATVDAFQHWIYSHPGHTRQERTAAWLKLMDRFGGDVDWTGYEKARANLWHRQLHIFLHPFYYVEYGIAQLGALQVWANSKREKTKALADYKKGLSLGGSRPLPELFAAAGCRFEFTRTTMKPLVELVRTELAKLN
ncbi:M3 family oligoendopeptidase [Pedosphaera parvula]|uniref:Oligoendopeptidase, M3 family n=1 Tax=Pedosphaera parvula (strain Ellin514) TaxID=320771 RepID=B9XIA2_PEDPL|nr:M3 family oligoendopeptidase [Pedosphaera parvula]EEF60363.1 oligoendopeptidase, M3 family [Pedosphaera parvula Ellin514]